MHHWDGKDFYATLAVRRSDDLATIKESYRALARAFHPDIAGPGSEERMKLITEAWSVLSTQRVQYDEHLRAFEADRRRRRAQQEQAARERSHAAERAARAQREAFDRAEAERRHRQARHAEEVRRLLHDPSLSLAHVDAMLRGIWASVLVPTRGADVHQTARLDRLQWRSGVQVRCGWSGDVVVPPLQAAGVYVYAGCGWPGIFGGPPGDLYLDVRHMDERGAVIPGGFRVRTLRGVLASAVRSAWRLVTLLVRGIALCVVVALLTMLGFWLAHR